MATRLEKHIGWLLAITAVIWAAYVLTSMRGFAGAYLRLGPMQLLMAGILLWLHGKYRTAQPDHQEIVPPSHIRPATKKAA